MLREGVSCAQTDAARWHENKLAIDHFKINFTVYSRSLFDSSLNESSSRIELSCAEFGSICCGSFSSNWESGCTSSGIELVGETDRLACKPASDGDVIVIGTSSIFAGKECSFT